MQCSCIFPTVTLSDAVDQAQRVGIAQDFEDLPAEGDYLAAVAGVFVLVCLGCNSLGLFYPENPGSRKGISLQNTAKYAENVVKLHAW